MTLDAKLAYARTALRAARFDGNPADIARALHLIDRLLDQKLRERDAVPA